MNSWINKVWQSKIHTDKKLLMFNKIDEYVKHSPSSILDIGCGLATESSKFQKKYNCDLYLLDGDFHSTADRLRNVNYGSSPTMTFYSKIDDLKKAWDSDNLRYNFIDANDINISNEIKFDIIYSFESCGFHYPVSTYADLVKKHSHAGTVVVFDIRKKTYKIQSEFFETIDILHETRKSKTVVLKFN